MLSHTVCELLLTRKNQNTSYIQVTEKYVVIALRYTGALMKYKVKSWAKYRHHCRDLSLHSYFIEADKASLDNKPKSLRINGQLADILIFRPDILKAIIVASIRQFKFRESTR